MTKQIHVLLRLCGHWYFYNEYNAYANFYVLCCLYRRARCPNNRCSVAYLHIGVHYEGDCHYSSATFCWCASPICKHHPQVFTADTLCCSARAFRLSSPLISAHQYNSSGDLNAMRHFMRFQSQIFATFGILCSYDIGLCCVRTYVCVLVERLCSHAPMYLLRVR